MYDVAILSNPLFSLYQILLSFFHSFPAVLMNLLQPSEQLLNTTMVSYYPYLDYDYINVTGKIIHYGDWQGVQVVNVVREFAERGAAAIMLGSSSGDPGRAYYLFEQLRWSHDYYAEIPVFQYSWSLTPWIYYEGPDLVEYRARLTSQGIATPSLDSSASQLLQ